MGTTRSQSWTSLSPLQSGFMDMILYPLTGLTLEDLMPENERLTNYTQIPGNSEGTGYGSSQWVKDYYAKQGFFPTDLPKDTGTPPGDFVDPTPGTTRTTNSGAVTGGLLPASLTEYLGQYGNYQRKADQLGNELASLGDAYEEEMDPWVEGYHEGLGTTSRHLEDLYNEIMGRGGYQSQIEQLSRDPVTTIKFGNMTIPVYNNKKINTLANALNSINNTINDYGTTQGNLLHQGFENIRENEGQEYTTRQGGLLSAGEMAGKGMTAAQNLFDSIYAPALESFYSMLTNPSASSSQSRSKTSTPSSSGLSFGLGVGPFSVKYTPQ